MVEDQGLMLEDIVTFLRVSLGLTIGPPAISDIFFDCEKDFILKNSDIKVNWLELTNQTEQFAYKFSLKGNYSFKSGNLCHEDSKKVW